MQGKSTIVGHATRTPTGISFVLVKCQMGTCACFLSGWNRSSEFSPKHQWWPHSSCGVDINRLLELGNAWHFMGSGEMERASYLPSVYYNTPAAVPGAWLLAPHIKGLFFFLFFFISSVARELACKNLEPSALFMGGLGVSWGGDPSRLPGRELRMPVELYSLHLRGVAILHGLNN